MALARPNPDQAADLAEFIGLLEALVVHAGSPSHRDLAKRVGPLLRPPQALSKSTLGDVFLPTRRRLNLDLVVGIVRALGVDDAETARWRAACVRVQAQTKTGGPAGVFRQLPADLATFTGRETAMKELLDAVAVPGGDRSPTVVVSAIEGMGGVGKTRLAVHVAHELVRDGRFGDLQLYVNLRGFDSEHPPADPADVLDGFLRALEVPAQHIPADLEARAAMFRDRMHGVRAIVLLDNAASAEQVRPLIPASPDCLVLITSRRSLVELDEATLHQLDVFHLAESVELLERIAGVDRVRSEPQAAEAIVEFCGRLPLAVALVASQLRARPAWSLAHLLDRLTSGRQDLLQTDGKNLQTVFDLSYQSLPENTRLLFRLLSLHPGTDFTATSAAALADMPEAETDRLLEALCDEHLLEQRRAGRYEFHDLLHAYAAQRARVEAPAADRSAAIARVLTWYQYATDRAAKALIPYLASRSMYGTAPANLPVFDSYDQALAWTGAEYSVQVAAIELAADTGLHHLAWRLAHSMMAQFTIGKHCSDWIDAGELALHSALASGEADAEPRILMNLAVAYYETGRAADGTACLQRALNSQYAHDSAPLRRGILSNLAYGHLLADDPDSAITCLEQALAIADDLDDTRVQGGILGNLAQAHTKQGRLDAAHDHALASLKIARASQDRDATATALNHLSGIELKRSNLSAALEHGHQSLEATADRANRNVRTEACFNVGYTCIALGRDSEACFHLAEALELLTESGDPRAEQVQADLAKLRGVDQGHGVHA